MAEPVAAGSVVLFTPDSPPKLLWTTRAEDVTLGGWQAFPGGVVEAADRDLPTDAPSEPAAVAALRELFEELGILLADGAESLSESAAEALREAFRRDPEEGGRRFRDAGLRFRTSEAVEVGHWITPDARAGVRVKRFDARFYAFEVPSPSVLRPDPAEIAVAEWVTADDALARWKRGEVLLAPSMAAVLRNARTRFDVEAMRREKNADGTMGDSYEVVPGVTMLALRTPTLPPATHTNAYLLGDEDAVLVEPASPYEDEIARAVRFVEEKRAAGIRLHAILATHHHPDHIGGAVALKEQLGLPLWGHAQTIARLDGVVGFEREIDDGEVISVGEDLEIEAVHTPGHAPGHLCFVHRPSGAMIAGDMVAGIGTILVEPHDGDMALYLESLRDIARREPSLLLPAHGGPIRESAAKAEAYVAHRLMREEKVMAALAAHGAPATPAEIVPVAYDDAPAAVYPIAAMATEAHLIKLVADGRVARQDGKFVAV
jgi:glyoxylase-like metal-dependent hydrolase (beta-lactamase superfamily II)/8-oxo-dGTP pyrophosphatase MutT (NUDIX family)